MSTVTAPDWIAPGARVAWLVSEGHRHKSVRFGDVERLTATQIILTDGSRWKIDDLAPVGGGGVWSEPHLRYPMDPEVTAIYREQRIRRTRDYGAAEAEELALQWRRDHDDEAARKLRDVIDSTLAEIDAIRAKD